MISGLFAVVSYFVSSLAFMNQTLETLSKFMPYHYFQTVFTFKEINLEWLLALLGISLLMGAAAWLRFVRRNIRLAGEGSWRLTFRLNQK